MGDREAKRKLKQTLKLSFRGRRLGSGMLKPIPSSLVSDKRRSLELGTRFSEYANQKTTRKLVWANFC